MFKKLSLSLLIICLSFLIYGYTTATKSKDHSNDVSQDKKITTKNSEIVTDKKYQNILTILEKETAESNNGVFFTDPDMPKNELLISNQLHMIVNSELKKHIPSRNYDFVLWYINKYLTTKDTALKNKYNSYSELIEGVKKAFPKLYNFNNQADMTNISYVESGFNRLLLEYYEYKYFLSLTKQQQAIVEKERIAWQEYKSVAMKFFTAFHVEDGGSIAGIFRANYLDSLNEQYLSTVLGCSFTESTTDTDIGSNDDNNKKLKLNYTFIDTFPKYLEKVYSNKSTKSVITDSYNSKKSFEKLLELSKAEVVAWNNWINIRNSYNTNEFDSKNCNYEYYTDMLKRTKLIDMKNLYFNHAYADSSVKEILLRPSSTVEEILDYDFITRYK